MVTQKFETGKWGMDGVKMLRDSGRRGREGDWNVGFDKQRRFARAALVEVEEEGD